MHGGAHPGDEVGVPLGLATSYKPKIEHFHQHQQLASAITLWNTNGTYAVHVYCHDYHDYHHIITPLRMATMTTMTAVTTMTTMTMP